ncbi:MAG: hypothetical protein QXQ48_03845 [Nitrososphaerota archaeon]
MPGGGEDLACFLTPLAAAIILTILDRVVTRWKRISILNLLMWGGATGLMADHIINGELVPWPPFLTGWNPAAGIYPLIEEILFTGGLITASITALWGTVLIASKLRAILIPAKTRALFRAR